MLAAGQNLLSRTKIQTYFILATLEVHTYYKIYSAAGMLQMARLTSSFIFTSLPLWSNNIVQYHWHAMIPIYQTIVVVDGQFDNGIRHIGDGTDATRKQSHFAIFCE